MNLFLKKVEIEMKKVAGNRDSVRVVRNNVQMYLFITFPNCPLNIIQKIIDVYLAP